jgi:hypothetical protein
MNASAKSVVTGEAGWTCLPFKWNFVETVACPGEDLCPAATPSAKYNRGKSWTDLLTEARDQYEGVNFAKYDYFYNTGLKAGVRYQ